MMSRRFNYDKMSAADFEASLARLDMSEGAFARITGALPRTVERWCLAENDIPNWVPLILDLFETTPGTLGQARQWAAENIRTDTARPGVEYPYLEDEMVDNG